MAAPTPASHPLAVYLAALQSARDALTEARRRLAARSDDATPVAAERAQARSAASRLDLLIVRLDGSRDAFLVGVFTATLPPSSGLVEATVQLAKSLGRTSVASELIDLVDTYLGGAAAVATGRHLPAPSPGGLLSAATEAPFTFRAELARDMPALRPVRFGTAAPGATRGAAQGATHSAPPLIEPTPPTSGATARDGPPPPSPASPRAVNVALEDQPPDAVLQAGTWYTLALDVDVVARAESLATTAFAEDALFPDGVDEIAVTVQLDSADFEIADATRTLRIPRSGKSRNKARFDLAPKHDGPSTVTATLHKDGNFVQSIAIRFVVGGAQAVPIETTTRGRPAASAAMLKPRDVGVRLALAADGYDCAVWGAVSSGARLPLQPAFLASAVEALRRELMKVVMYQDANGNYVFQTGIDIADVDRDAALKTMARAGALLFQKLFFGPAAGDDSKRVGTFLRQVASDPAKRLNLQVVAEVAPIPWGLLYVGDASAGATLDWDLFLGMRHVIEEIPLQTTMAVLDCEIGSEPRLSVSVNVNSGIDAQLGGSYVADTNAYWVKAQAAKARIGVTSRTTSADVMHALADGTTDDQIVYFYCHAESAGLADPAGPDASALVLTDARITLADLALDAPTSTPLRGQPLVFINACESAELSPAFYDGFVPYFMAKGARGVIGTQCKTPALFAVEWASRFFDRFLDGAPLGQAFLDLRREFLAQHGNPLGLLYAVHCDGDTQIDPALT